MQTTPVCLRAADGSRVSAIAHYEYGVSADAAVLLASTRITDALGDTLYDPGDFEEVTVGVCPTDVQCVESQEYTYGVDNTGTTPQDVATYCLVLSDGSMLEWAQDGSDATWSAQLTTWAAEIQAAADVVGLRWFSEPRYVDSVPGGDLTSIDGTVRGPGGSPSGLPGAPTIPISQALAAGGMYARYVNLQICPGQPVPVRAFRKTSTTYGDEEYDLASVGAILGPIKKFWMCAECGKEPVWYLEDAVTLADAGQVPSCWEPCGTLALSDGPADPVCTFEIDVACDNNNLQTTADFTNTITRRAQVCNGEQIAVDYFQADPDDANALIPYELVGDFVDCASGEPVAIPVPPCDDFEIVELYQIVGKTPGLRNREWITDDPTFAFGTDGPARDYAYAFDYDSAPDTDTVVTDFVASLNDTSNTANELDLQLRTGYLCVPEAFEMRWTTGSEGALLVRLGKCCGPLEEVLWHPKDVGSGATPSIVIPAGIHKLWILNQDSGGSNSNWQPETSTDGVNWIRNDRVWDDLASTSLPREVCKKVKVCKPSGALVGLLDGAPVDPADCYACSIACEPCCPAGEGGGASAQTVRITEAP